MRNSMVKKPIRWFGAYPSIFPKPMLGIWLGPWALNVVVWKVLFVIGRHHPPMEATP